MKHMDNEIFEQQELFRQEKYISDLIEQKTPKNKSSLNTIFGSSILTSMIVLSFLYVFGIFNEDEFIIPDPITITETITEKEVIMPRIDSTSIFASICSTILRVIDNPKPVPPKFLVVVESAC